MTTSLRDSLDALFGAQQSVQDREGLLALVAHSMPHDPPRALLLAESDGRLRSLFPAGSLVGELPAEELAAELSRRLLAKDAWIGPAGDGVCAFGLRLWEPASGVILGGLPPAAVDTQQWFEENMASLRLAATLCWRALDATTELAESQARVRQLLAEHQTLAAAHTAAMISAMEEQEKLQRAQRERLAFEAASRAKSEFLAHMSHEIRTPLNAILGFAELLVDERQMADPLQRRDCATTIVRSGTHLLELINDILDLSKIEAGEMNVRRVACSPKEIVDTVMSQFRGRAAEKGLAFECVWQTPAPSLIVTDPLRFKQVLINLLGNAVKFTACGEVRLNIACVDDDDMPKLRLEVRDTGVGISREKQATIFEPFVQADGSITREFGGTGLGLTISRRIARALGGDITVQSTPGKGSVFTATIAAPPSDGALPQLEAAIQASPPAAGDDAAGVNLAGARILVVDDSPVNRRLLRLLLGKAGAVVEEAENGEVAVRRAHQDRFDAVIMDMQMPVMDGFTATRLLRSQGHDMPIIAFTASVMKEDRDRCREAGCTSFLTKPIHCNALLQGLAESLGPRLPGGNIGGRSHGAVCSADGEPLVSTLSCDEVEMREIVREFASRLKTELPAMQAALDSEDYSALARKAHWLKGSGGTLGFPAFTEPARQLDHAAQHGQPVLCAEMLAQIRSLAARIVVPEGPSGDRLSPSGSP